MSSTADNPIPTPAPTPASKPAPRPQPGGGPTRANRESVGSERVLQRRTLYWQNVMREVLSGLASAAAASAGRLSATPSAAAAGGSPVSELFDGRLAVMTTSGARIPIADVVPMFACSVADGPPSARGLAEDVQCTVFQIRTPGGEIHTLPLHEITGFHALSEQLIRKLQAASAGTVDRGVERAREDRGPFGFAAFTSLAHAEREQSDS